MDKPKTEVGVRIGVIVPQGVDHEYDGWDPVAAWSRSVAVGRQAEALGFDSLWVYDHFHTDPEPADELTFESFAMLSGLGSATSQVRLGQLVLSAGFRNPALVAKIVATLDVMTGGRMILGLGSGWKKDEWVGYGYGYPATAERLAMLSDSLEVVTRMLGPGRATFEGRYWHVSGAVNEPKGLQHPRVPILVGGNGPNVTWRLAARHADDLNLDGLSPDEVAAALPVVRARCEEIGRPPDSLAISVHLWGDLSHQDGARRTERLAAYRELGISRVIAQVHESAASDVALQSLANDARNAGLELSAPP
jgi:F420-dependent oxidoreductase-like protein